MSIGQFFDFYGISTIVLILTLFAILWYAWKTRRLKQETIRQTELSLSPDVILETFIGSLRFKNIGLSPALNIVIDPVDVIDKEGLIISLFFFISLFHIDQNRMPPIILKD